MNNLVEIYDKEPRVSTFKLWKDFGYGEHRALKQVINKNKSSFLEFGILRRGNAELDGARGAGRPDTGFLLNESQCMILITLVKTSKKANDLKVRLIKEFNRRGEALKELTKPSAHIEEIRKILLLDAPSQWVKLFPPEFYTALMKLYGKEFTSNNHTPPYCGQITRKWIYNRVLPKELQDEIDVKRNIEKRHQWFTEKNGRATLLNQINQVTGIARMSRDRKHFEDNCEIAFNNAPLQLNIFL